MNPNFGGCTVVVYGIGLVTNQGQRGCGGTWWKVNIVWGSFCCYNFSTYHPPNYLRHRPCHLSKVGRQTLRMGDSQGQPAEGMVYPSTSPTQFNPIRSPSIPIESPAPLHWSLSGRVFKSLDGQLRLQDLAVLSALALGLAKRSWKGHEDGDFLGKLPI